MVVVRRRGYEGKRGLVRKSGGSDERAESERKLESVGAMNAGCARKRLCVEWAWGNYFLANA